MRHSCLWGLCVLVVVLFSCQSGWQEEDHGTYHVILQKKGPALGYSPESGVSILTIHGRAFKDLNRNGELDPYEDWRLPAEDRARNLASDLSVEEIAGLMLYSSHQAIPGPGVSSDDENLLTDEQRRFLKEDHLRAVLITSVESPAVAARWNNDQQAFVEGLDHGIPCNTSSDPRHQSVSDKEYFAGSGGAISLWPGSLGLAATFDPDLVEEFGRIASAEYRALGIATALSPQVDIATEPRWWRFEGTFGEDPDLSTDMARAYCDGFQSSDEGGWGSGSVNAMVKHWYGYGAQEGGRDSHFAHGEYATYPGNNLAEHLKPFVDGAFHLKGGTGMASAVMSIYSILWNQDPSGENVGGAYSDFVIRRQLREKAGFDGVVCTDWGVTHDCTTMDFRGGGKPWGVEDLTVAERHYRILRVGVDQFGGNNDSGPILEAYRLWTEEFGEESARARFEDSARRLLLNIFRTGLFENPYTDPEESTRIVGNPEFMQAGYEAQLKSVVMLKNTGILPAAKAKVYVPKRHYPATPGIWGGMSRDYIDYPVKPELVQKYFDVVETPEEADFALVIIQEPGLSMGYDLDDVAKGGNGYIPVSLQYEDYTATEAREESIAGGNPLESFTNRSYKGKTVHTRNYDDLVLVRDTKKALGDKPLVLVIDIGKPVVLKELEPYADAILLSFGVQRQAILDIVSGQAEPSGLLPMQLPSDMSTVEHQLEDVPRDMECYCDAQGHVYDFAFGLNWQGVIQDVRVQKYK